MAFTHDYRRGQDETREAFQGRALPALEAIDSDQDIDMFRIDNVDLTDGWQRTTIIIEHKPR